VGIGNGCKAYCTGNGKKGKKADTKAHHRRLNGDISGNFVFKIM